MRSLTQEGHGVRDFVRRLLKQNERFSRECNANYDGDMAPQSLCKGRFMVAYYLFVFRI